MGTDITGLRSGRLTAIRPTEEKRRGCTLWLCRCDCGRELLLEPYRITGERTKSCGCSRKGRAAKDLTDMRFGSLVAQYRTEEKRGSCYLWHCRCDCGRELEVTTNALLSGNTKSCGCEKIQKLRERAKDLTGQRFGSLTALAPTEKRAHGGVVWRCACDCGTECEVSYNSLTKGNTTSCGCKRRAHDAPPLHYIDNTCIEMIDHPILRKDNTSGYTGVVAMQNGTWMAQITFQGRRHCLGVYKNIQQAAAARREAENRLFGGYLESYYLNSEESPVDDDQAPVDPCEESA